MTEFGQHVFGLYEDDGGVVKPISQFCDYSIVYYDSFGKDYGVWIYRGACTSHSNSRLGGSEALIDCRDGVL